MVQPPHKHPPLVGHKTNKGEQQVSRFIAAAIDVISNNADVFRAGCSRHLFYYSRRNTLVRNRHRQNHAAFFAVVGVATNKR